MGAQIRISALDCPKCGSPLDVIENERITVCVFCGVSVLLNWQNLQNLTGVLSSGSLTETQRAEILSSFKLKLAGYYQEWLQLERSCENAWRGYKDQKARILGKSESTTFLDKKSNQRLEAYGNDLKDSLLSLESRSNKIALKVDLTLKSCKNLDTTYRDSSFAAWPSMFSNILEWAPQGALYRGHFEPFIFELSHRNLLVNELGKIDSFIPLQFLMKAMPVMMTRELPFAQAAEINNRLMAAGGLGRIALTSLTQGLVLDLKSFIKNSGIRR